MLIQLLLPLWADKLTSDALPGILYMVVLLCSFLLCFMSLVEAGKTSHIFSQYYSSVISACHLLTGFC